MFTIFMTAVISLLLTVVVYYYYRHRKSSHYTDWRDTTEFYETVYTEEYRDAYNAYVPKSFANLIN